MAEVHTRMQALDGLRAVSILLVVVSHAGLGHIIPGGLGVTIFFFISGFIITRMLIAEYAGNGSISIQNFYVRRLFRLMPALTVYLLVSLLVMVGSGQPVKLMDFAAVLLYFSNFYYFLVGFAQDTLLSPLRITWSLAIEEHYYFVYPALFAALAARPRVLLRLIGAGTVAVLCWRIYLVWSMGLNDFTIGRIYMGTDTRVDAILFGAGLALMEAYSPALAAVLRSKAAFWSGALLLLSTLLVRSDMFRETIRYTLQGGALALMFHRLLLTDTAAQRALAHPIMTYIGRISYSLYLYHWLALGVVFMLMPQSSLIAKWAVLMPASFLLAHLSYRYIEQPFLNIGRALLARRQTKRANQPCRNSEAV